MCCLIACKTKRLDLPTIQKIWDTNDDGAGVGWLEGAKAKYIKGLSSPMEVWKTIQNIPLPFVVHFRLQSTGGNSPLLTHPFEVTRESKLRLRGESHRLLFHNGHDGDYNKYLSAANLHVKDKSPMNDTRALAIIISNNNERFLQIATGKFILVDGTCGRFKTFGDFTESNEYPGILFSNMIWRYRQKGMTCITSNKGVSYSHHQNSNQQNCAAAQKVIDAEVTDFESEGGKTIVEEKSQVSAPAQKEESDNLPVKSYHLMTMAEKEEYWNKFFGRNGNVEYWRRFYKQKTTGQTTPEKLRLMNGCSSEL